MAKPYVFRYGNAVWMIPGHMMEGVQAYIGEGRPPGGFLRAIFENNLVRAAGHADEENIRSLPAYASFLYNEAPRNCWGSREIVQQWIEKHEVFRKAEKEKKR